MPFNYYLLTYTSQAHGLVWALFSDLRRVVECDAAAT